VEILRVLLRKPRVLILDEPTAVLAPEEVEGLLDLLRSLAGDGRAVVIVAHKLDEVLAVADRVTVLRGGRTVLEAEREEVDADVLSEAMVGRAVQRVQRPPPVPGGGRVAARLRSVGLQRADGSQALREVDLTVGAGTIVGVAGIEGNGQRELALVLAGRVRSTSGLVEIPPDPGFVPQDRRSEGLVLGFDLAENLALFLQRDPAYRWGPFLRWSHVREKAREEMDRYSVLAPSPRTRAGELSGGNQQRWVLARELTGRRGLLVVENPSRGLDVAGAAFVHRELLGLREAESPPGIVLISTDLDEVLSLSDRVCVMVRGRLIEVPEGERSREGVGARMLSVGGAG
jgi:simple sugar transport system ATP-binding protein